MSSRRHVPARLALTAAAVLALTVSAGLAALPAAAAAPSDTSLSILVKTSDAQPLVDAISARAATDDAYRRTAEALTGIWIQHLRDGKAQDLWDLNALPVSRRISELTSLKASLASMGQARARAQRHPGRAAAGFAAHAQAGRTARAFNVGDGNSPNSFPVKGAPAGNRSYWTGMTLFVQGGPCNSNGCKTTDKFTTRVTVNPGAAASSVCVTSSTYLPNGGNLGNKHLHLWAINRGKIVGERDTSDISSLKAPSNCFYVINDPQLNGQPLTVAVTLWVYHKPTSRYYADGAKTSDAKCRTKGDNRCFY